MVCWVAERARAARNVDRVVVATDSQQIADAVRDRGIEAIMTAAHHTSGTDRVAEVAAQLPDAEIIVNVQGDEPLISPATIERAVETMAAERGRPCGYGIGMRAQIAVPKSGAESIVIDPPTACTRSSILRRPSVAALVRSAFMSKPAPSSEINRIRSCPTLSSTPEI